jgi:crotonobetainyl-CoA:carnitine CoA-transferase CaiB-like acyl-CoA transferase
VFVQSYRPGALAKRGFGPNELAALRPGIVYVSLNAWGDVGPWRNRRGFDSVVQAVSGIAHLSGDGTRPGNIPAAAIDYVAGDLMALGAMAALHRRATEGASWHVRVSLARVGQWIVERGLVAPADEAATPRELAPDVIASLCMQRVTPSGTISHLMPVVGMSETPCFWARPSALPGTHKAAWPAG